MAKKGKYKFARNVSAVSESVSAAALEAKAIQMLNTGDYRSALVLAEQLVEARPGSLAAYILKGQGHYFLGQFEEALECFVSALKIDTENAAVYLDIGNVFHALHDHVKALEYFEKSAALNPENGLIYNNMANALKALGANAQVVVEHYKMAISKAPGNASYYYNLCIYLSSLQLKAECYSVAEQGVNKCPDSPLLLLMVAERQEQYKNYARAFDYYKRVFELEPQSGVSLVKLVAMSKQLCNWDDEEKYKAILLENFDSLFFGANRVVTERSVLSNVTPFDLLACDVHPALQKKVTEIFVDKRTVNLPDPKFKYVFSEKIKIGYISPDFNSHPVGFLIDDIFKYHSREAFEVFGYYLRSQQQSDEQTACIADSCDHFHYLGGMTDLDIARKINVDGIQILVDLSGYTADTRPKVLDLKPAPVQCHGLGYPGTLGSVKIDYYLTTPIYTPADTAEHFSEQMAYLPDVVIATRSFEYEEPLPTRQALGLPEDKFVFYCFSNFYRVTRDTFEAWIQVLLQVDDSVLWLFDHDEKGRQQLLNYAAERGVTNERFVFTPVERITYRGVHRLADLLLDSIGLPSGTAAIISLSEGVPIVSMAGLMPQSRTCLNYMAGSGMQHLVASDTSEFVNIATRMGSDEDYYLQQKELLRSNLPTAPLFNRPQYIRNLESLYRQMIDRYRSKLPVSAGPLSVD